MKVSDRRRIFEENSPGAAGADQNITKTRNFPGRNDSLYSVCHNTPWCSFLCSSLREKAPASARGAELRNAPPSLGLPKELQNKKANFLSFDREHFTVTPPSHQAGLPPWPGWGSHAAVGSCPPARLAVGPAMQQSPPWLPALLLEFYSQRTKSHLNQTLLFPILKTKIKPRINWPAI